MGWGLSDRRDGEFEEWYGVSAATLQWKPSYNEIMLQHRLERVPRWQKVDSRDQQTSTTPSREEAKAAVWDLYQSLDELDALKIMADNYQWDDIKTILNPNNDDSSLRKSLEYSLDILKSVHSNSDSEEEEDDLSTIIGFDWGSCAWRHCGAKADGQEALAELYSSVGMLEPFECRFVIGEFFLFGNVCVVVGL